MPSPWWLLISVLTPAAAGVLTLGLPRRWVTPRVLLAAAGPAAAFGLVVTHLSVYGVAGNTGGAGNVVAVPGGTGVLPWVPSMHLDVAFLADGLGAFFALLVSGVGVLIVLYARGYFGKTEQAQADLARFYPTLGFFATAMMGLVLADYTLLTLVFWELTSISSFLLIGWDRFDRKALKLAKQAFFTTGLGGMGLLGGVALFGYSTGVWRWSELLAQAGTIDFTSGGVAWAFALMFVGAASKSAQWPLHYWLPGAMAAPTPVSAYLHSATMVKAGVFLLGRLFPAFAPAAGLSAGAGVDVWPHLLTWFGAVTMLYGGVTAVNQHDLKRIFAYTTVSQLGLLVAMYGIGGFEYHHHPSIDFDITQIANHAFYKAPLFICAGAIGHVASRKLPELFGAFREHKAICVTMLLAGYALAAGPGTVSFAAKELFLYGVVHAAKGAPVLWLVLVMTVATAACNVAIFVRLLTTLMGWRFGMGGAKPQAAEEHHDHHHPHEGGLWGAMIWLPAVPLVAVQYVGGLVTPAWNAVFLPFEKYAFYKGFHGEVPSLIHAVTHPGLPLLASLLAIALGVLLGISRLLRGAHTDVNDAVYPAVEAGSVGVGRGVFAVLQNGNLRYYTMAVLVVLCGAFGLAVWQDPAMRSVVGPAWARAFELPLGVMLGAIICVSALLLPVIGSRVVRVLLLGSCGFTVVAMYIVYQAPDLVLTQLMVEIISVLLFVLVLRMLPADPQRKVRIGVAWRAALATVSGLVLGWMTLVAAGGDAAAMTDRLGGWFVQNSYHGEDLADGGHGRGGGGFNVVNVILVDFRGFDTLGEVTVLALAALGVWSMLPGRGAEFRRMQAEAAKREGGDA
ncbi:MAG: hydrogen gas-evolving membrane-bound hydrogenase subunit E [Planctomycetota bacterium]